MNVYLEEVNDKLVELCNKFGTDTVAKYTRALSFLSTKYIPKNKDVYEVLFTTYGVNDQTISIAGNVAIFEINCKIKNYNKEHLVSVTKSVLNNYFELV